METFRQIVTVSPDRKIEMTLPAAIPLGQAEIVVVVQPLSEQTASTSSPDTNNLFGFLEKRIDPLQFERQMRDEWNR